MNNDFQKHAAGLENWLAPIFAKAPHLPQGARATIVSIAPWLALLGGILGLFAFWTAGAFSVFLMFSFFGSGMQLLWMVGLVVLLIASILDLMAFSPLRSHSKRGWNLLFYGTVLSGISTLLDIFIGYGSIGNVIGLLIGLWLLFEVRPSYH